MKHYPIGPNHDEIREYKVHLNTISDGELSDPLCDSAKQRYDFPQINIHFLDFFDIDF